MARVDRERYGYRALERRKQRDRRRPLMLKIRVRPLVPMSKTKLLDRLERSVESGVLDPLIEVFTADWAKGSGAKVNRGRLPPPVHRELFAFLDAMRAAREGRGLSRVRVERTE